MLKSNMHIDTPHDKKEVFTKQEKRLHMKYKAQLKENAYLFLFAILLNSKMVKNFPFVFFV